MNMQAGRVIWRLRGAILASALLSLLAQSAPAAEPLTPSEGAALLDERIDWERTRLIAVQDANRYKTLDSFARESMVEMTGNANLPGLSPLASLFEWVFNRDAYADIPLIKIRDKGLRIHFTAHMPESAAARKRILETGKMTPREFSDDVVMARVRELEPRFEMTTAIRRVRQAEGVARFLERMLTIVPQPGGTVDAPWHSPASLLANMPDVLKVFGVTREQLEQRVGRLETIENLSEQQALAVLLPWAALREAWLKHDAAGVQQNLDKLAEVLPTLAATGVYPSHSQRSAEALYYRLDKLTYGWVLYLLGGLIGVVALVTGWRTPWGISLALLVLALTAHAFGIGLRWYIVGRIPVANMFEAVVSSAWVGIAAALVAELAYRSRVFLVAAHATGFLALMLGTFVIPGGGTITSIMGILDDVMLRIHTVLIISSYALIFLAGVIALIYLFGYYFSTAPAQSMEMGFVTAAMGAVLLLLGAWIFVQNPNPTDASAVIKHGAIGAGFGFAALGAALLVPVLIWFRAPGSLHMLLAVLLATCLTTAVGDHAFITGMAYIMIGGGGVWGLGNLCGMWWRRSAPAAAPQRLALAGVSGQSWAAAAELQRPIMAGGAPGDERSRELPGWLKQVDWSHLIILNMVFIMLFVGIILGAVWADYSWGRPWGWDPKEVFAMNTWLIYAILIHVRFVVKDRGLWTAWLSVAGCLMMAFNWCFVNFFIVGLHSYA